MSEYTVQVTGAHVTHILNPLDGSREVFFGACDAPLIELAPKIRAPVLCMVNGEFVLPEDWDLVPGPMDRVVFATPLHGGGGDSNPLTTILGIVLIAVGFFFPGVWTPYLYAIGAGLLVSGLIPTPSVTPLVQTNQESPSPTYSTSLSGNTARLGQAIPVPYGYHPIMPDFACQSYTEYTATGDQLFHAIFCLGMMEKHSNVRVTIDDTPISHFQDVELQFQGPGYAFIIDKVDPAVVNSPEVAGQELTDNSPIGPFAVCGPGLQAKSLSYDIVLPKGLYFANDQGELEELTISWLVEGRPINNQGNPAGSWFLIGVETMTMATNTPVRRTFKYTFSAPGRYEVQMKRNDVRNTNVRAGHDAQWAAMRAHLLVSQSLDPNCVFMGVRIKANGQLSGLSQRRFTVFQQRHIREWDPVNGWSALKASRSIAWACVDALKNPVYGPGVSDDRIDLQTFYELHQLWEKRGDVFDAVFDKRTTVWSAMGTILRVGRAIPLMRGSVYTAVRDSKPDFPVAMFNMRNIKRKSLHMNFVMPSDSDPDGLTMEYFDSEKWAQDYVDVVVEGVEESVSPATATLMGAVHRPQVLREAKHVVDDATFRRGRISFDTELEGYLPAFGDPIAVTHDVIGVGQSGEIEEWASPIALCSEDLVWDVGSHYVMLVNEQGDPHGPYLVEPGDNPRSMRFLELPGYLVYAGLEQERTRYVFGAATTYATLCKVRTITPKGSEVNIVAVIEDDRMHSDADFIGVPGGGVPGSGDRIARYMAAGSPNYDVASDEQHNSGGFFSSEDVTVGVNADQGYVYGSPDS